MCRARAAGPIAERVLDALTSHPMLVAWYAQNRVFKHPNIHSMPIGLDYHTLSPLDELFARLPVVIVDDWSEVTPSRLCSELDRIARSSFDFSQLELSYWTARIQSQPSREGLLLRYDDFLSSLPE